MFTKLRTTRISSKHLFRTQLRDGRTSKWGGNWALEGATSIKLQLLPGLSLPLLMEQRRLRKEGAQMGWLTHVTLKERQTNQVKCDPSDLMTSSYWTNYFRPPDILSRENFNAWENYQNIAGPQPSSVNVFLGKAAAPFITKALGEAWPWRIWLLSSGYVSSGRCFYTHPTGQQPLYFPPEGRARNNHSCQLQISWQSPLR